MNYFRRALTSVGRRPGKSLILLLLVFILGNVISGAISIQNAVQGTDANLRELLPAIASIDFETIGNWEEEQEGIETERVTPEMIRAIGNLPQVRNFNYSLRDESFSDLYRAFNLTGHELWDSEYMAMDDIEDSASLRSEGAEFDRFDLVGLSMPELFEVQSGLMELVSGRLMTAEEIVSGAPVVIISRGLAQENELDIGSTFDLTQAEFDWTAGAYWPRIVAERYFLSRQDVQLEVVGIIDFMDGLEGNDFWEVNGRKWRIENRLIVPNRIVETVLRHRLELQFYSPSSHYMTNWHDRNLTFEQVVAEHLSYRVLFLLDNPAYLGEFSEAANAMLPPHFFVSYLSNRFGDVSASMDNMLLLADYVLYVAIGATLVILSLLVTLFLRDRKHEIGIYLAIGEKKRKVAFQIIIEVMAIALIAATLSLFTGSMLSETISQEMLRNDLLMDSDSIRQEDMTWGQAELAFYSPGELSVEEMLLAYDMSMSQETIVFFFGVAIVTVLVSTLAPITYVMRLNPKKILM